MSDRTYTEELPLTVERMHVTIRHHFPSPSELTLRETEERLFRALERFAVREPSPSHHG